MSIKPAIEAAIAATADRLNPGSGASAVKQARNDVSMIEATSENLSSRYAGVPVSIATTALFEAKQPDGDPVSFGKKREGLVVVYPDSFIFVRNMGFGAREVKAMGKNEVTVEKVMTVVDGAQVPGLRIAARIGKPRFALAIAPASGPANAAEQAAVRDELYSSLGSQA